MSHGAVFPPQLLHHQQPIVYLRPHEHHLPAEPLALDAAIWDLCTQQPNLYRLLLCDADHEPVEFSGAALAELLAGGQLKLYPATFRLVFQSS